MENKNTNKDLRLRNFVWTIFGILFLAGLGIAVTTMSDNSITTTGNVTIDGKLNAKSFNNELMRANDSVFETANNFTEYYSPQQHGGIYGTTIYRRYYYIPDASGTGATVNIAIGTTITGTIVSLNGLGVVELQSSNNWYTAPNVDFGGGARNLEFTATTTTITLKAGSTLDWRNGGYLYIDYTK